ELDEAATIDGAGPFRILMTIIVPQARAAIIALAVFHFFFAWTDFLEPCICLAGERHKYPISVGLYGFIGLYKSSANLIQAGAIIAMAFPIGVFLFGQRYFTKGIDISGSTHKPAPEARSAAPVRSPTCRRTLPRSSIRTPMR